VIVVLASRWLRALPPVADFVAQYPGVAQAVASPAGIPGWVAVLHFLNAFLLVLIVKSGWAVRSTRRPAAYWTRGKTRISLDLWLHYSVDALWIVCGVVFLVLTFATGHWVRIVPTGVDVLPNALSAALQYASFDWPTENGWNAYNALQLLAYFVTIFIAAPLAFITGLRMSAFWPTRAGALSRAFPIGIARAVHFPVMLYFVLFTIVHVVLVLATGVVRNLNHMFAVRNDDSPLGVIMFAAALIVMAAAVIAARPILLRPLASLTGTVTR
jgi:thiosulfate reductase cytochrome b subunit